MRVLIVLLLWLSAGTWAQAQDSDAAVALFADTMRVEAGNGVITATGNVEAFYQDTQLTARVIRYDSRTGEITAEGPIVLQSGEDVVLLASLAQLSGDFQAGLIEGARLILDRRCRSAPPRRGAARAATTRSTARWPPAASSARKTPRRSGACAPPAWCMTRRASGCISKTPGWTCSACQCSICRGCACPPRGWSARRGG